MMNYREQVQRVLSVHHARIELGLNKVREQEMFVSRIGDILRRNCIEHSLHLNLQFDVVFRLPEHIMGAENLLRTVFVGCYLERGGKGWIVSDAVHEYLQVRLMGDNDDGL